MVKLAPTDLEALCLGIMKNGRFNEGDIAESGLKRLGVGGMLDLLASLRDRKLLRLDQDGSFAVTDLARRTLWDRDVPARLRILRLLEIKPCKVEDIADIMQLHHAAIAEEVEGLRKGGLVLMSPLRQGEMLVRMYEILPEGVEELKKIDAGRISGSAAPSALPDSDMQELIDEIMHDVKESGAAKAGPIIEKLRRLKSLIA